MLISSKCLVATIVLHYQFYQNNSHKPQASGLGIVNITELAFKSRRNQIEA